jgi:hypothetical protein
MRTDFIEVLGVIAVVAENLETFREFVHLEPCI